MHSLATVTTAKNVTYARQIKILSKLNERNNPILLARYNACLEEYTEVISVEYLAFAAGMDNCPDNNVVN
jgi:hypothetical protein